jgi:CDGSH-type Zn-finger protein
LWLTRYFTGSVSSAIAGSPQTQVFKMADVTIEIRKNGPYRVRGDVKLVDHDGNPVLIPEGRRKTTPEGDSWISLCRCGGSVVKPFCDGTHSKIGFVGAEEAVKQTEAIPPSP